MYILFNRFIQSNLKQKPLNSKYFLVREHKMKSSQFFLYNFPQFNIEEINKEKESKNKFLLYKESFPNFKVKREMY